MRWKRKPKPPDGNFIQPARELLPYGAVGSRHFLRFVFCISHDIQDPGPGPGLSTALRGGVMVEFDPFRSHFSSHERQLLRSIATASSLASISRPWCRGFSEEVQ